MHGIHAIYAAVTSTTGGGSSSGASTGGATTGAALKLTDGRACAANTECSSGVCGVNGTGYCCHVSCGDAGETCNATACDETGTCLFPAAGGQCEPDACADGTLTTTNATEPETAKPRRRPPARATWAAPPTAAPAGFLAAPTMLA